MGILKMLITTHRETARKDRSNYFMEKNKSEKENKTKQKDTVQPHK